MRKISNLTCLTLIAFGLSACSSTPDILQGFYDAKAQDDCRAQTKANDGIHSNVKSNCNGYEFDSKKNQNALDEKKKPDWKQESEARKKSQIENYGQ